MIINFESICAFFIGYFIFGIAWAHLTVMYQPLLFVDDCSRKKVHKLLKIFFPLSFWKGVPEETISCLSAFKGYASLLNIGASSKHHYAYIAIESIIWPVSILWCMTIHLSKYIISRLRRIWNLSPTRHQAGLPFIGLIQNIKNKPLDWKACSWKLSSMKKNNSVTGIKMIPSNIYPEFQTILGSSSCHENHIHVSFATTCIKVCHRSDNPRIIRKDSGILGIERRSND